MNVLLYRSGRSTLNTTAQSTVNTTKQCFSNAGSRPNKRSHGHTVFWAQKTGNIYRQFEPRPPVNWTLLFMSTPKCMSWFFYNYILDGKVLQRQLCILKKNKPKQLIGCINSSFSLRRNWRIVENLQEYKTTLFLVFTTLCLKSLRPLLKIIWFKFVFF